MVSPPLDLGVYKKAADFVFAGKSPYSEEFIDPKIYLPWVYTPFATILLLPLHFIPTNLLLIFWTIFGISIPLVVLVLTAYQGIFVSKSFEHSEKKYLFAIFFLLAASAGPLIDAWAIGQIGLIIAALTLFDLSAPSNWFNFGKFKLPRGMLAGIAGAMKLVPLIVIPFWLVTRQTKQAMIALGTVIFSWGLAFIALPNYSIEYFTKKHFLATNGVENVSSTDNQSLIGAAMRALNTDQLPTWLWIGILLLTSSVGIIFASITYKNGNLLNAGIIVGLTSTLASPVSWIHHIVWLVAVPGALLRDSGFRKMSGKLTSQAWLWYISLLMVAIPPLRYGWSPFRRLGLTEQYNLISILFIALLWWLSRKKTIKI
ncbi:MAG: hypothetical protein RIS61_562 [Actinomycetota bacterium]